MSERLGRRPAEPTTVIPAEDIRRHRLSRWMVVVVIGSLVLAAGVVG